MKSLASCIEAYCGAVAAGDLPRAYRGILASLSAFKSAWQTAHPEDAVGSVYAGYMDMSFVAVAPDALAARRLKVSLVFLHAEARFSLWLAAGNRAIQAKTASELRKKPLGAYAFCPLQPGVDAIIASEIPPPYAFDDPEALSGPLLLAAEAFLADMEALLA
ncbi:MAG: hypothetical protein GX417_04715 [Clostridiales bacterium]|nr:hypothetical protein [Clostridiales bacterium]